MITDELDKALKEMLIAQQMSDGMREVLDATLDAIQAGLVGAAYTGARPLGAWAKMFVEAREVRGDYK